MPYSNFHHQCSIGTIDVGDLGEITACLILLFALDKMQVGNFPKPQTLRHFLDSLFGNAAVSGHAFGHRRVWSDNLKNLWDQGYVFFNHFDRLQGGISVDVLEKAWARGAALIAFPGTNYYDLVIPVLLPNTKSMTCILIQVKNRKDDDLTRGLRMEAMDLMNKASTSLSKKGIEAHFFIHMALRTTGTPMAFFDVSGYQQSRRNAGDDETEDQMGVDEPGKDDKNEEKREGGKHKKKQQGGNGKKKADNTSKKKQADKRTIQEEDDRGKKTEHYVVVSCGLDEKIFPSLGDGEAESKRIVSLLQNLLRLKTADNFENLTPYQRNLAPISHKS